MDYLFKRKGSDRIQRVVEFSDLLLKLDDGTILSQNELFDNYEQIRDIESINSTDSYEVWVDTLIACTPDAIKITSKPEEPSKGSSTEEKAKRFLEKGNSTFVYNDDLE